MKTYILMLSDKFLSDHPKKGLATNFATTFRNALAAANGTTIKTTSTTVPWYLKKHTCRKDYDRWVKRFEEINAGEACLSVRIWAERPRQSAQVELRKLTKENGIGLQRLDFIPDTDGNGYSVTVDGKPKALDKIAHQDGLSLPDWIDWMAKADKSQPMALIQFTPFRY